MIDLYRETASSPANRAELIRRMDGMTSSGMKAPLLDWLADEPDATVRGEVAENLRHYRTDPAVVQALNHAAEFDKSQTVRRAAVAALEGKEP